MSEWRDNPNPADRLEPIKRVLARVFGDGENPLAWGFSLWTLGATRVRFHLLFAVYLLAELIFTLPAHNEGAVFVAPRIAAVVVIAALREHARLWVCRRRGIPYDSIMLWPLGSLTEPGTNEDDEPSTAITLSGITAQIGFAIPLAAALIALTRNPAVLATNPLNPSAALPALNLASTGTTPWWLVALWSFHVVNTAVLLINLLPMIPLDAGVLLRTRLARTRTEHESRATTALVGVIAATVTGIVGIVFEDATPLLGVAIVCGLFASVERQRLKFLSTASPWAAPDTRPDPDPKPKNTPDPDEIDRILAKVSKSGIHTLSRSERRILKQATRSSRESEGD